MISVVFMCKGRLPLSKMVLLRFKEYMDIDYEIILAYDDSNIQYVNELSKIVSFKHKSINFNNVSQGEILADAHRHCSGEYYMFLENDWWWERKDCVRIGMEMLDTYKDVHMIRLLKNGIGYTSGEVREYKNYSIYQIKYPYMKFHFNPQVRNILLPSGEYVHHSNVGHINLESEMDRNWLPRYNSWCMQERGFGHIGVIGEYNKWCPPEFANKIPTLNDVYNINFYGAKLKDLNFRGEYKELFEEYIMGAISKLNRKFTWNE